MTFTLAFWIFFAGAIGFGWQVGRRQDRHVVAAVIVATTATFVANGALGIEQALLAVAIIDFGLLVFLLVAALRTDRYWPLWFTGFQFAAVLTSLSALLLSGENRWIFQTLGGFWAIPALIVMCIGLAKDRLAKISVAD